LLVHISPPLSYLLDGQVFRYRIFGSSVKFREAAGVFSVASGSLKAVLLADFLPLMNITLLKAFAELLCFVEWQSVGVSRAELTSSGRASNARSLSTTW
jgi:hypothetical protein